MLIWWAALVVGPLAANDTIVTLGAGGLTPLKSADVSMESEDLDISVGLVRVRYVFRNRGPRDIEAVVAFPLPEINGAAIANEPFVFPSKDPLNFVNFHVKVNGREVRPQVEVRAFLEGREVGARLKALGLGLAVLDPQVRRALDRLAKEKREGLCECFERVGCFPYWTNRIQYYWTQRFPAGGTIAVEHTYQPVVGGSYITAESDGKSTVERYCGAALKGAHAELREKRIQYILTTANNWRGPIGRFHLTIAAESPTDIMLTCFPGVRRTAPGRWDLTSGDFHPDRELDVLILQGKKP